jgi:hypothetical protein
MALVACRLTLKCHRVTRIETKLSERRTLQAVVTAVQGRRLFVNEHAEIRVLGRVRLLAVVDPNSICICANEERDLTAGWRGT